ALARDVGTLAALLQCRADDHIVDLGGINAGAPDRLGDGMPGEHLRLGIVEGTAIGSADRRAGGGDDDGAAHGLLLLGSIGLAGASPPDARYRAPGRSAHR